MRHSHGFTLLEMVIVLFLATLIVGLTTMMFAGALTSGRFNSTVRDMRTTIRAAKHLARKSGKRQVLTIDLDARTYVLRGRKGKKIPESVKLTIIDPLSEEISQGRYEIVFGPYGGSPGERFIFTSGRKQASIDMDPVIGAVIIR